MSTHCCESSRSFQETHYVDLRHPSSPALDLGPPFHPPANHNLGEIILTANYGADDELRRIIALIRQLNKWKIQHLLCLGVRKLLPFSLIRTALYTWTIGWCSQRFCKQLFRGPSTGDTLDAMRRIGNLRIWWRTCSATFYFVSKLARNVQVEVRI